MAEHEHSTNDDGSVVVRPQTAHARAHVPSPTIVATFRARSTTSLGLEIEHVRQIRYTAGDVDGIRYVEVVDSDGNHVASGMGKAADALADLVLYLLPPDHSDYPGT